MAKLLQQCGERLNNNMSKKDFFAQLNNVRQILRQDWDPIGVGDDIDAKDEYDSYVFDIYQMLKDGKPADDLLNYLFWAEQERMGLTPNKEQAKKVVAKLITLNETSG